MSWLRRYRRAFENEEGISLVELMVAMFVLAVALMALAAVTASSVTSLRVSRSRQMAVDAVSAALEDARALDYTDVALVPGATTETHFDADGDGTPDEIVFAADGGVVHQSTAGVGNEISLVTYVTWEGQDEDGDGIVDVSRAARRVTTIATWTDGGRTRTVSESTTIAHAERGLPVPNFGAQPATASKSVPPGGASGPCPVRIDHTITNVGAPDAYEVRIAGNGETVSLTGNVFDSANTKWNATVYMTHAVDGVGSPDDPTTDPNTHDMRDYSPVGDSYAEGIDETNDPIRLATGDSAYLTFCYTPASDAKNATFTVTVRSRFDNAITETLTHNLFVSETAVTLYLHDPDNTQDHQRKNSPSIFTMDTTATTVDGFFNYDTNLDPDGMAGLWLKDGDSTSQVVWDYQTPNSITIDTASLFIYGALDAGDGVDEKAVLTITLQHVNTNGNTVLANVSPTSPLTIFPGADRTFKSGTLEWLFSGPVTIAAEERLRLTITCHTESTDDCHVMYDSASFLSRLGVSG